jgi:hypothetical protein
MIKIRNIKKNGHFCLTLKWLGYFSGSHLVLTVQKNDTNSVQEMAI